MRSLKDSFIVFANSYEYMFEEKTETTMFDIFLIAPMTERRNEVPLIESSNQKFLEKERK